MKNKDTSVDQVFALVMRLAKFLRNRISEFDGELFQNVIRQRHHPFWTQLEQLCKSTFTIPFSFTEIGTPSHISGRAYATSLLLDRILVTQDVQKFFSDLRVTVEIPPYEIVYIYPSEEVTDADVLNEFWKRGLSPASPEDCIRHVIEKDLTCIKGPKYLHNIVFLNTVNPSRSLELGSDAMGCTYLALAKSRISCCYAARRPIQS